MAIEVSKVNYRLILNARIYGGVFWATLGLGAAWIISWVIAPRYSDFLQMALSIPPSAYFIIYFVGLVRHRKLGPRNDAGL